MDKVFFFFFFFFFLFIFLIIGDILSHHFKILNNVTLCIPLNIDNNFYKNLT
jgi:hypothetical protein